MQNDSTMIYWGGEPRAQKRWETDLYFRDAFHYSCVPCYQGISRKIGTNKMKDYLKKLNYGKMVFDSTSLDMFWLEGDSKISQHQQINFLKTFKEQRLPITKKTHTVMSRLMIIEEHEHYTLRGKTGWAVENNKDNCWYVGYIETKNNTCYFATNIEPGEQTNINSLPHIRKEVTHKAFKLLGIFN